MSYARAANDVGISDRQRLLLFQEEATKQHDKILNIFVLVDALHALSADDLKRLAGRAKIDGRPAFTISRGANKAPHKADAERLMRALPKHLIACYVGQLPQRQPSHQASAEELAHAKSRAAALSPGVQLLGVSPEAHVAAGIRLLTQLCDLAAKLPTLCHVLNDVTFREDVLDLVVLILVASAGPAVPTCLRLAQSPSVDDASEALERAELVPLALLLVASGSGPPLVTPGGRDIVFGSGGVSAHYQLLSKRALGLPASEVLLGAMFDGVRTVVRMVRVALLQPEGHAAVDVYQLAYHGGVAMEVLAELLAIPLFYQRLMLNDPSGAAPLRLARDAVALHDAPLAPPPYIINDAGCFQGVPNPSQTTTARGNGAAELLAARGAMLLSMLAEREVPLFLDSAAEGVAAHVAADVALCIARDTELLLQRPPAPACAPSPGETQLMLAVMRAAENLADDSNHRERMMQSLAQPLSAALACCNTDFNSTWCGGAIAVALYEGALPLLVASLTPAATLVTDAIAATAPHVIQVPAHWPAEEASVAQQGALERGLLLFKLIGNLHAHSPDSRLPQDNFLKWLVEKLPAGGLPKAAGNMAALHAWADTVRTVAQQLQEEPADAGIILLPEVDLRLAENFGKKLALLAKGGTFEDIAKMNQEDDARVAAMEAAAHSQPVKREHPPDTAPAVHQPVVKKRQTAALDFSPLASPEPRSRLPKAEHHQALSGADDNSAEEESSEDDGLEPSGTGDSGAPNSSEAAEEASSDSAEMVPCGRSATQSGGRSSKQHRRSMHSGRAAAALNPRSPSAGFSGAGKSSSPHGEYDIPMSVTTIYSRLRIAAVIARAWDIVTQPQPVTLVLPDGVREESLIYLESDKRTGRLSRRWTAIVRRLDIQAGDTLHVKAAEPLRPLVVGLSLTRSREAQARGLTGIPFHPDFAASAVPKLAPLPAMPASLPQAGQLGQSKMRGNEMPNTGNN